MKKNTIFLALGLALLPVLGYGATLSRQNLGDAAAGLDPSYSSITAGGDQVTNTDGKTILHFLNTSSSTVVVTVTAQNATTTKPGFGTVTRANIVATVASQTGKVFLGPFPIDAFNDSSGNIQITYSTGGATVSALKNP